MLPEDHAHLLAVGVGVPGLVDPAKGIAVDYKYIHGWQQVALAAPLARRFGVPVYLENNIRSMALAELWFGQGRGVSDWVCLGIRSGIGAGIVAGGQLQRGAHCQSGEVGRWRCPWPRSSAARYFMTAAAAPRDVELQEIASARALLAAWARARRARFGPGAMRDSPAETLADLAGASRDGNPLAAQVIRVAARTLGWAVSQLALALNPSRVILTGPLTLLGEELLAPLRDSAQAALARAGADTPAILNSTMGDYVGALGAAALAVHEWKPASLPA